MNRKFIAVLAIFMLGTLTLAATAEDNLSSFLDNTFRKAVAEDSDLSLTKTVRNSDISSTRDARKINSIDADGINVDDDFSTDGFGIWGLGNVPVANGLFSFARSRNVINIKLLDEDDNLFAYLRLNLKPTTSSRQQIPFSGHIYLINNDGTTYIKNVDGSLYYSSGVEFHAFWAITTATDEVLSKYGEIVSYGWLYGYIVTDADSISIPDIKITYSSQFGRINGLWGVLNNPVPQGEFRADYSPNIFYGEVISKNGNIAKAKITVRPATHLTQREFEFTGQIYDLDEVGDTVYIRGSFSINSISNRNGIIVAFWDVVSPTAASVDSTARYNGGYGWFFGEVN